MFAGPELSSPILATLLLASCCVLSCTLVSGIEEFEFGAGGSGNAAGSGATSTSGGSGGDGAAPAGGGGASQGGADGGTGPGGGGMCPGGTKPCASGCEPLDVAHGCEAASCDACPTGSTDCCTQGDKGITNECVDTTRDPLHCGGCGDCQDKEYCFDGSCECKPDLVNSAGNCVEQNPADCGAGTCSGGTPKCQSGSCVSTCGGAFTECLTNVCVDTDSHPLHCGSCMNACNNDEVCAAGECVQFQVGLGCSSCACGACGGSFPLCCTYPSTPDIICVSEDAEACP